MVVQVLGERGVMSRGGWGREEGGRGGGCRVREEEEAGERASVGDGIGSASAKRWERETGEGERAGEHGGKACRKR